MSVCELRVSSSPGQTIVEPRQPIIKNAFFRWYIYIYFSEHILLRGIHIIFPLLYPTLQLQDLQGTEGRVGKAGAGVLQALTQSSYHRFVLLFSFLFGFYWIICWFDNVRQTNTHSGPIVSLLFHHLKYYVQLFVFICTQISQQVLLLFS